MVVLLSASTFVFRTDVGYPILFRARRSSADIVEAVAASSRWVPTIGFGGEAAVTEQ